MAIAFRLVLAHFADVARRRAVEFLESAKRARIAARRAELVLVPTLRAELAGRRFCARLELTRGALDARHLAQICRKIPRKAGIADIARFRILEKTFGAILAPLKLELKLARVAFFARCLAQVCRGRVPSWAASGEMPIY